MTSKILVNDCQPMKKASRVYRAQVQIIIMTVSGVIAYFFLGHKLLAFVIWFFALLLLFGSLFAPSIVRGLDRFGTWLGHFIGTTITYILLVPMYYTVFLPGRIVITILGRDPMNKKWLPDAVTYWVDRAELDNTTHFTKQY